MMDKKLRIALIAAIACIAIIAAIFLIPILGSSGNNTDKNSVETVQANPKSDTVIKDTADVRPESQGVNDSGAATEKTKDAASPGRTVTFIELGSVKCIPCKMMQPVMKKIEETYKNEVKVVFYDVWTEKDKARADEYRINAIPTQVFLDKEGNEYYRHAGFFPFEEIEKVLKQKL